MPIDQVVLDGSLNGVVLDAHVGDVAKHVLADVPSRSTRTREAAEPARPQTPPAPGAEATQQALRALHALLGSEQLERYFIGQARVQFVPASSSQESPTLVVTVATGLNAQIIERRFGAVLQSVARELAPGVGARVRFVVDRSAFVASTPEASPQSASRASTTPATPSPSPASTTRSGQRPATGTSAGLSALGRYRLEDFLVGVSNRLAVAAVRQLVDMPQPRTPQGVQGLSHVFLHGSCGLGKTHLLQGAARRFLEQRPGSKVRYVTGEQFTNEFLTALRTSTIDKFRAAYRGVDLLCIDDVHFLANKDATQEELLHTLDAVGLSGARVLLASDAHPHHIAKLSQKLVGRFLSSAVVKIDTPDPALRRQLVRHLAARRGMLLASDAVELLAQRSERAMGAMHGFGGSVREIEGLVNQVDAVARLLETTCAPAGTSAGELSAHDVRRALGIDERAAQARSTMPGKPVAVKAIVDHVCSALCVEPADFRGKGRHKRVVFARSIVAHLAREMTTQSFPEIARAMGRDNHSTIITAQRRLIAQLGSTPTQTLDTDLAPMHPGCSLQELLETLRGGVQSMPLATGR